MPARFFCDRCSAEITTTHGRVTGLVGKLAFEVVTGKLQDNGASVTWNAGAFCALCVRQAVAGIQAQLSCLLCGQPGTPAVTHEPTGIWCCQRCRDATLPVPAPGVVLSAEDVEWLRDVLMPVVGCYQHEHERQSMLTRLRAIIDRAAIPAPGVTPTQRVLDEVAAERVRQDATWGEQNHPSLDRVLLERPGGCTPERMAEEYEIPTEERARFLLAAAVTRGSPSWAGILVEEISESVKAGVRSDAACRAELVQVAAVAVAWIECIDRRAAVPAPGRAEEA